MSDQYRQRMQASSWGHEDGSARGGSNVPQDNAARSTVEAQAKNYRQRMQMSSIGQTSYPEGQKYSHMSRDDNVQSPSRFVGNPSMQTREQYMLNKRSAHDGMMADQPMFGDPSVPEDDRFNRDMPVRPTHKHSKKVSQRPASVNPITGEQEVYGDVARVDYKQWNKGITQKHIGAEERNASQHGMIIPESTNTESWDHVYDRRHHDVDTASVAQQNRAARKANREKIQKNALVLGDEEAADRWERNKATSQPSTFKHGKRLGEFSDEYFLHDDPNYQPPANRQAQVIAELTRKEMQERLMLQRGHKLPREYAEPTPDPRIVDESKYRKNASHVIAHTLADHSQQDFQRSVSTSRQDTYHRRNQGTPLFDSYNPGKDYDQWKRNDGPQNVDVQQNISNSNHYPHLARQRQDLLARNMGSRNFQRAQHDPAVVNAPVPVNYAPQLYAETSKVRKNMAERSHNSAITFSDTVDESTIRRQARPVRVSQVFGARVNLNPGKADGFKPNLNNVAGMCVCLCIYMCVCVCVHIYMCVCVCV
jgi:hypothetical protein